MSIFQYSLPNLIIFLSICLKLNIRQKDGVILEYIRTLGRIINYCCSKVVSNNLPNIVRIRIALKRLKVI